MGCLEAMGASFYAEGSDVEVIKGIDLQREGCRVLDCGESGSTLRFLIPVCAVTGGNTLLRGEESLMRRPLCVYESFAKEGRLNMSRSEEGIRIGGGMKAGEYETDGSISSQFASGLMFALPLLKGDSRLTFNTRPQSRPYIDMTKTALDMYGISSEWNGDSCLLLPGDQCYMPAEVYVEGDWSNSAALLALGAEVTGLDERSLQGDRVCREYIERLRSSDAEPPVLDISDCPDLGPVLMSLGAINRGVILTGAGRLKYKESDRGEAMRQELSHFGIDVKVSEDEIRVGAGLREPDSPLNGHNDHRIVMALTMLCSVTGGSIDGAEAVDKSFPEFFDSMEKLGLITERNTIYA